MGRIQFFEFEDLPWFPRLLRTYMQDYLRFVANIDRKTVSAFVNRLKPAMAKMGETRLIDLCSGGAGPVRSVLDLLASEHQYPATATLTDLYPNLRAYQLEEQQSQGRISYAAYSVDATQVPEEMRGFRHLANAFHHFPPPLARSILADAVAKKQGIAVVEIVERSLVSVASMLVAMIFCLVSAPFLKPFRISRLFMTYVIPVIPIFVLFDGTVSCFRVYSPEELTELVRTVRGHDQFDWEIGRLPIRKTPAKLTYLIGTPKTNLPNQSSSTV